MDYSTEQLHILARLSEDLSDEDAWRDLYVAFWPRVIRYCYSAVTDRDLARDAAQEAFLTLLRQRARVRFDDPDTLALQIWSRCRDACRKIRRLESTLESLSESIVLIDSPELRGVELATLIDHITTYLNPSEIVLLRLWLLDTTSEEIAQALGTKIGTVAVRKHRLRERIRKVLQDNEL